MNVIDLRIVVRPAAFCANCAEHTAIDLLPRLKAVITSTWILESIINGEVAGPTSLFSSVRTITVGDAISITMETSLFLANHAQAERTLDRTMRQVEKMAQEAYGKTLLLHAQLQVFAFMANEFGKMIPSLIPTPPSRLFDKLSEYRKVSRASRIAALKGGGIGGFLSRRLRTRRGDSEQQ